nr:ubiquitin carboxyl-terminal hydrolase 14 [Tanacetum cinerariifolium]
MDLGIQDLPILATVAIWLQLYKLYYMNQSLKQAFTFAPADPTVDLNMQLTKLANGLLSRKYYVPAVRVEDDMANTTDSSPNEKQEVIRPRMFESVITTSHLEFSTMRQQDILEFFLHLIDQIERVNASKLESDPARKNATDKKELEEFHKLNAQKEAEETKI